MLENPCKPYRLKTSLLNGSGLDGHFSLRISRPMFGNLLPNASNLSCARYSQPIDFSRLDLLLLPLDRLYQA